MELKQVEGGIHIDERGAVSFVNDFQFDQVKRFYTVRNHRSPFIRAWHGHKKEGKYVTVVNGSAIIGAIKIDNWDSLVAMDDALEARLFKMDKCPPLVFECHQKIFDLYIKNKK